MVRPSVPAVGNADGQTQHRSFANPVTERLRLALLEFKRPPVTATSVPVRQECIVLGEFGSSTVDAKVTLPVGLV
jgi:hypothetical protein